MIKISDLKTPYSVYGNKGAVRLNKCHIQDNSKVPGSLGFGETLCGVPILAINWAVVDDLREINAEPITHIGCPQCINIYVQCVDTDVDFNA